MDIKMAFLHGHFHEEIYMRYLGYELERLVYLGYEHQIRWLLRSLCGVKQAPCAWYECIDSYFHHVGFQCIATDCNVYVY
jgi:hypothetical protein